MRTVKERETSGRTVEKGSSNGSDQRLDNEDDDMSIRGSYVCQPQKVSKFYHSRNE